MRLLVCLLFLLAGSFPASAQVMREESPLAVEADEQRARQIFRELRCEVCAGQSIADSNAPLAQDMRAAVRGMVETGEADDAILEYFSSRYGRDILMRPPVDSTTLPLWLAPLVVIMAGVWMLMRYFARRQKDTQF